MVAKVEPDDFDEAVTGRFGYAGYNRANDQAGDQRQRQVDDSKSAKEHEQRECKNDNRY